MKYNLTHEQYQLLWKKVLYQHQEVCYNNSERQDFFNTKLTNIYNLTYEEPPARSNTTKPGYWGTIEGDEKYITMFLLKL